MLDLYKNIRERRKELNMSQDELARKVGYTSRSTIARIENGEIDISRSKILAFADALRTTPAELMGWSDEEGFFDETDHAHDLAVKLSDDPELLAIVERAESDSDYKERLLQIAQLLEGTK